MYNQIEDTVQEENVMLRLFGFVNQLLHQQQGWLLSDCTTGEETDCGCPRLAAFQVMCGCEASLIKC